VDRDAAWRREADRTGTLRLSREADGTRLVLRLRAYAVRDGMAPKTFLAAHAMWMAEEARPRIEYSWDADLQAWHGYSLADEEVYYAFRIAGDRAYVLEESADAGALDADAADEFMRILSHLECTPRTALSRAVRSSNHPREPTKQ